MKAAGRSAKQVRKRRAGNFTEISQVLVKLIFHPLGEIMFFSTTKHGGFASGDKELIHFCVFPPFVPPLGLRRAQSSRPETLGVEGRLRVEG